MISKAKFDPTNFEKKTGKHRTICSQGFDNYVYIQPFVISESITLYQFIYKNDVYWAQILTTEVYIEHYDIKYQMSESSFIVNLISTKSAMWCKTISIIRRAIQWFFFKDKFSDVLKTCITFTYIHPFRSVNGFLFYERL